MTTAQKEQLIRNYTDAYNRFDVEGMLNTLSDDIHFENHSQGEVNLSLDGIEAFGKQARFAASAFKERRQTILSLRHEADQSHAEIDYRGVLAVDLPIGPKNGEDIQLKGKSVFRFSEDKISHITDIS